MLRHTRGLDLSRDSGGLPATAVTASAVVELINNVSALPREPIVYSSDGTYKKKIMWSGGIKIVPSIS